MSRLDLNFTPHTTAQTILNQVEQKLGRIPNVFKTLANSPVTLSSYDSLSKHLTQGKLSATQREQIALAIAQFNQCEYCTAAHTYLAQKVGISASEIDQNRLGKSSDPQTQALLQFVTDLLKTHGAVSNEQLTRFIEAGFSNEIAVEIIANIATSILTNYANNLAKTEVDFPTS